MKEVTLRIQDDEIWFNNRRYVPAETLPEITTAAPTPTPIRLMDMRLRILQALNHLPNLTANEMVLVQMLQQYGHHTGLEQFRVELAWLMQVANALVYRVHEEVHYATLTQDGRDISYGYRIVPGISRNS